MIGEGKALART